MDPLAVDEMIRLETLPYDEKLRVKSHVPLQIDNIRVFGCKKTDPAFLVSYFDKALRSNTLNDTVNNIENAVEKLRALRVFDTASVECVPSATPGAAEIVVSVKETNPKTLTTAPYFNNSSAVLETSFQKKNLFGRFESFSVTGTVASDTSNAVDIEYRKPNIGRLGLDLVSKVSHSTANNQLAQSHHVTSTGVQVGVASAATVSGLSHSFSYTWALRNLHSASHAADEIQAWSGNHVKSSVEYKLSRDLEGLKLSCATEVGGLSEATQFVKAHLHAQFSSKIFENRDLALEGDTQFGVIQRIGSERPIHPSDRFLLGGVGSLRGFESNGVGPKAERKEGNGYDMTGGDLIGSVTLGVSSPLSHPWLASFGARAHAFVGAGNLVTHKPSSTLSTDVRHLLEGVRVSTGAGMGIPVAGGRLELNWCLPLLDANDSRRTFQIGYSRFF